MDATRATTLLALYTLGELLGDGIVRRLDIVIHFLIGFDIVFRQLLRQLEEFFVVAFPLFESRLDALTRLVVRLVGSSRTFERFHERAFEMVVLLVVILLLILGRHQEARHSRFLRTHLTGKVTEVLVHQLHPAAQRGGRLLPSLGQPEFEQEILGIGPGLQALRRYSPDCDRTRVGLGVVLRPIIRNAPFDRHQSAIVRQAEIVGLIPIIIIPVIMIARPLRFVVTWFRRPDSPLFRPLLLPTHTVDGICLFPYEVEASFPILPEPLLIELDSSTVLPL
ncbi:hypothetical protein IU441_15575 [Nocardia cyriacigeorgica]|nr:hypothetical protein [Nocardia cyriacigeorgica]